MKTTAAGGWRYVLCAGFLMIVLDMTVVNVALPYIQDDLKFTTSSLAWVVNAYLIAFGGLLLLSGRVGDLLGRRNVFLTGMTMFVAASLLCGLAQSQAWLVAARFAQGVGGALTSAVILGMIVTMFPSPKDQAKAFGIYAFVASAGGAIGLLVGGVLVQAINWHWIFFVNLPIGLVTGFLALRLIDRDNGIGLSEGADVPGSVLITSSLMLGVYTIVKPAAEDGWTASKTLVLGAVAVGLLTAFVVRQKTAAKPLMPLRIFKSRNIAGANLVQITAIAGMFGIFFLGSLYLERVLGYKAIEIGLAFLPTTVIMGFLSVRYSERLIMRFGPRNVILPSLVFIGAAIWWFTNATVDGSYWINVLPSMVLLGMGSGACFPALMNLAMADVEPHEAGIASGLVNTTGQVGAALGLAILATLSNSRTEELVGRGVGMNDALVSGFRHGYWAGVVMLAIGFVTALTLLKSKPKVGESATEAQAEERIPEFATD